VPQQYYDSSLGASPYDDPVLQQFYDSSLGASPYDDPVLQQFYDSSLGASPYDQPPRNLGSGVRQNLQGSSRGVRQVLLSRKILTSGHDAKVHVFPMHRIPDGAWVWERRDKPHDDKSKFHSVWKGPYLPNHQAPVYIVQMQFGPAA
jgi:hypothetical protein